MAMPIVKRNHDRGADTVPVDSFNQFDQLNREMFNFFDPWRPLIGAVSLQGFTPLADIEESDDAFVMEVELPGVKKGDITIEVSGRRMSVRGERKEKERDGILRRSERIVGNFSYEVTLPNDIDPDKVEASLEEGVLTVKAPKAQGARPKRIELN